MERSKQLVDPAMAIGVASGSNRINSSGAALAELQKGRSSQIFANIVPAGGTLTVPVTGNCFYFLTLTLLVQVRVQGGVFNPFTQGKGMKFVAENNFPMLEIRNENAVAVVFQLFVGFDEYIDNTLILDNASGRKNIVYPTAPVPNVSANILIPDLSGTKINDINGNQWYALNRLSIYVSNADAAAVYDLVNTANDKTAVLFQPLQTLSLPFSGNFRMTEAGNINAIVSETYEAIPVTVT